MHIDIVSIFPEYLTPLRISLLGKAIRNGVLSVDVHDLRDWAHDRHRTVDDTPYGGGAGMVMRPEPWGEALDSIVERGSPASSGSSVGSGREAYGQSDRPMLLVPTPSGRRFTQQMAVELAAEPWLIFACGRYEGIDQRVIDDAARYCRVVPFSLGDYVLNGGEVAALAVIEAVGRLIPGVVGNPESLIEESHSDGLLEYPVYTKPPVWRDHRVPEVLLGGDHGAITRWRTEQSKIKTAVTRPDLLHPSQTLTESGLEEGELRLAQRGDGAELNVLTKACWVAEALANERLDIPALHETLAELTAELSDWTTLVLRSHGRLVGSVRGRYAERDWEIGRLMVAPDLQGQGIGRWLLTRIEALAPEQAEEFRLMIGERSRRNLRIYRKAGYRPAPWRPAPPGAVSLVKRR